MRDESGKEHAVRLVIEPASSRQGQDDLVRMLLAHTSLETNASINLTVLGVNGTPRQASLYSMIAEWCHFRLATVERRTRHRLTAAEKRIHILEGRLAVLLDIDEVIQVIRESDEPKVDLMAHFKLSEIQAEDILEIRLRQLARLEGIKIEQELDKLREEAAGLNKLLDSRRRSACLRRGRNRGRRQEIRRRPPHLHRSRCQGHDVGCQDGFHRR